MSIVLPAMLAAGGAFGPVQNRRGHIKRRRKRREVKVGKSFTGPEPSRSRHFW